VPITLPGASSYDRPVRLGLVTPIVSLNPRFETPAWELEGGIDDLVVVAQAAEALGYAFVGCPEHVAVPESAAGQRGGRYWDPVATLSYLAAQTSTIRLLSHIVVLGYHHPLAVVKRYGTIDVLSGGRLVLGVGVGSLRGEFLLLGADFDRRGALADESIATIRAAWGRQSVTVVLPDGRKTDWIVEPSGAAEQIPIWVGGMSARSLRRALELGDGWIPFGLPHDALATMLGAPEVAEQVRRPGFEVVLAPEPPLDPVGDPAGAAAAVRAYAGIGATALALRFRHSSRSHYLEQLEAMRGAVLDAGESLSGPDIDLAQSG
jgi:probable F420-dependent oxidoreductase